MSEETHDLKELIGLVARGERLTVEQARTAFDIMMSGDATPAQMGGFLMGLRVRGETVDEITGGAMTMRAKMRRIEAPPEAMDIVGTGGDAKGTYNISTGSALVVSACGVPVAKHGNRAFSSRSGSADVLTALGVNIDADPEVVQRSISEASIGFMMAPRYHDAMRHVGGTRVDLGTRTIFNLLGPISNPAGVKRLLLGVFAREWVEPLGQVLGKLGTERAWVVHGGDGLDELTTTGPSHVAELKDGEVHTFEVNPEDAGLEPARLEDLLGADPETNARAMLDMLDGKASAFRDIILYNSAAALLVADKVDDLKAGVARAAAAIDSGEARAKLNHLVALSRQETSA